jgi:hypothetical protein
MTIGFGDEAVFLGGCPVIKPNDGIYVEGQRVIALAGAGTLGDADFYIGRMIVAPVLGTIAGAVVGAKMNKRHQTRGAAIGAPIGFAAGLGAAMLSVALWR